MDDGYNQDNLTSDVETVARAVLNTAPHSMLDYLKETKALYDEITIAARPWTGVELFLRGFSPIMEDLFFDEELGDPEFMDALWRCYKALENKCDKERQRLEQLLQDIVTVEQESSEDVELLSGARETLEWMHERIAGLTKLEGSVTEILLGDVIYGGPDAVYGECKRWIERGHKFKHKESYLTMAEACADLGHAEEAKQWYREAINENLNPTFGTVLLRRMGFETRGYLSDGPFPFDWTDGTPLLRDEDLARFAEQCFVGYLGPEPVNCLLDRAEAAKSYYGTGEQFKETLFYFQGPSGSGSSQA